MLKKGESMFPLGAFWENGITTGQGQAPVKRYNEYLRDLIIAGRAKSSFITIHRLLLSKTPEAYAKFDRCGTGEGVAWVVLKPRFGSQRRVRRTAASPRRNDCWHRACSDSGGGEIDMLWYAWVFLVIAIIAAILGFGGIAAGAASIAKILFFIFLVIFVVSLIVGRRRIV